jgi:hypothetical protein
MSLIHAVLPHPVADLRADWVPRHAMRIVLSSYVKPDAKRNWKKGQDGKFAKRLAARWPRERGPQR